ncbi:DNA protection during starvation protein 2 [Streptococcus pneumoniae]|nr:DNA protection during starvation protein 2 [Streptococcus pneumoniae]
MVEAIMKDYEMMLVELKKGMEIAQDSDDEMTSDLLLGIYTELEKHAWMLSSRWSWISFKAEAARLESLFYVMVALNGIRNYINDFSNISIITRNISTIFSLYRSLPAIYQRFDKGYQFADKSRQYQRPSPLLLSIYYNLIYVKI